MTMRACLSLYHSTRSVCAHFESLAAEGKSNFKLGEDFDFACSIKPTQCMYILEGGKKMQVTDYFAEPLRYRHSNNRIY